MKVERVYDGQDNVRGERFTMTIQRHELEQLHLILLNQHKMEELAMRIEEALQL